MRSRMLASILALATVFVGVSSPGLALDVGERMPKAALKDLSGKPIAASALAGKVVSVDSELDKAQALAKSLKLSFQSSHDAEHTLAEAFDPPRMPSSYVIDQKGIVRHIHAGFRAGDEAKIEREVRALLKLD